MYHWLKELLGRLSQNDWASSMISEIEGALRQNLEQAALQRDCRRVLADEFEAYRDNDLLIEYVFQYIIEEKIKAHYIGNASPASKIKWILATEGETVPFIALSVKFNSHDAMLSSLGDAYANFKNSLGGHNLPEQALADYFIRAQTESKVVLLDSDPPSRDEADYRWIKQFLCNIPENAVENGFHSMVPMLEYKGTQSLGRCCINQSIERTDVYAQQRMRWVC